MDAIKNLKNTYNLVDLAHRIGLHTTQRRDHSETACPACEDQNGHHLYLYDDGRFFCHKCKASGDMIDLYQLYANCTPKQAIEDVKQLFGYSLSSPAQNLTEKRFGTPKKKAGEVIDIPKVNVLDTDILGLYYDFAYSILSLSDRGRRYLQGRGISDKTIDEYEIKSIEEPEQVLKKLLEGFDTELLERSGLVDFSSGKARLTFFRPGIVFTHVHLSNAYSDPSYIAGFTTRNYEGDPKSCKLRGVPNPLFEGTNWSTAKNWFVFEGIITALSIYELTGQDNFLVTNGTVSPSQFRALQARFPDRNLVLALDPDERGEDARLKIKGADYLDWDSFAKQLGFNKMPSHPNGKKYDANDLLVKARGIL